MSHSRKPSVAKAVSKFTSKVKEKAKDAMHTVKQEGKKAKREIDSAVSKLNDPSPENRLERKVINRMEDARDVVEDGVYQAKKVPSKVGTTINKDIERLDELCDEATLIDVHSGNSEYQAAKKRIFSGLDKFHKKNDKEMIDKLKDFLKHIYSEHCNLDRISIEKEVRSFLRIYENGKVTPADKLQQLSTLESSIQLREDIKASILLKSFIRTAIGAIMGLVVGGVISFCTGGLGAVIGLPIATGGITGLVSYIHQRHNVINEDRKAWSLFGDFANLAKLNIGIEKKFQPKLLKV